jgi:hypothetical protein
MKEIIINNIINEIYGSEIKYREKGNTTVIESRDDVTDTSKTIYRGFLIIDNVVYKVVINRSKGNSPLCLESVILEKSFYKDNQLEKKTTVNFSEKEYERYPIKMNGILRDSSLVLDRVSEEDDELLQYSDFTITKVVNDNGIYNVLGYSKKIVNDKLIIERFSDIVDDCSSIDLNNIRRVKRKEKTFKKKI